MREPPPNPEAHPSNAADAIEAILEQYRRGENPGLSECLERYPGHRQEILDLFPTLKLLAGLGETGATPSHTPGLTGSTPGEAPRELGPYRIIRKVGRGGMGIVYEAEDSALGRRVALKVLLYHGLLDERQLDRFRWEAKAAARLQHPSIVPVHGVGEARGMHYYAMQFVDGRNLEQAVEEMRALRRHGSSTTTLVPEARAGSRARSSSLEHYRAAARIGCQAAEALAYAHAQGIVHRDIKPSNLLLDREGSVWVTDFGLATAADAGSWTRTGDIVGTLRYMAPERLAGPAAPADPRSDVYSLGLTLYELVTLQCAFDESDRNRLVGQVLHAEPAAPRKLADHLPRDLETIILRSIDKEPNLRYQSAEAVAIDLRHFLADEPIVARRSSGVERAWRWCRRNRSLAATLCVAVFLLLAAATAGLVARALREERNTALHEKARAETAEAAVKRSELETKVWSHFSRAQASRWSGLAGQRFASLEALAAAAAIFKDLELSGEKAATLRLLLRNEALASLTLADLRPGRRREIPGTALLGLHRDLELYAVRLEDGGLRVLRFAEDEVVADLPALGALPWPGSFSSDGRFFASAYHPSGATRAEVVIWDLDRKFPAVRRPMEPWGGAVAFSPDSRAAALGDHDGTVVLLELPSGSERDRLACDPEPCRACFDPTGGRIAVASARTFAVEVREVASGSAPWKLAHPARVTALAWRPGGDLIAAACADNRIYLWDARAGTLHEVLKGHQNQIIHAAFSHSGALLVSSSWDTTTRLWEPLAAVQLLGVAGTGLELSAGDDALCFDEGGRSPLRLSLWDLASGRECRTFAEPGRETLAVKGIDLSPDGRWLVAASRAGARLWDLAASREAAFLPLGVTWSVCFLPSGDTFVTSGERGLLLWRLERAARATGGGFRIGPPRALWDQRGLGSALLRRDAGALAVATGPGEAAVLEMSRPERRTWLREHPGLREPSPSPDGRWVAAGTWKGEKIRVWQASDGALVHELDGYSARAVFSPDGKWLVGTTGEEYNFWEAGTWRLSHRVERQGAGRLAGALAFSGDGGMLALARSRDAVTLVEPESGVELGTLRARPSLQVECLAVSAGGSTVAAAGVDNRIHVWDLRRLRAELSALGLDWEPPLAPAERAAESASEPAAVEVDLGELAR